MVISIVIAYRTVNAAGIYHRAECEEAKSCYLSSHLTAHFTLFLIYIYIYQDKRWALTSTALYYIKLAKITILSPGSLRPSQLKAINLRSQIADATITDIEAIKHARRT